MLPSGRRLAIDYGEVRIGLAMSDPTGTLSSPLMTLRNEVSNPDGTLHVNLQVPIQLLDERLSTKVAINQANAMGKKLGRDEVDQMAAVAILEFGLSFEKSIGNFAGNAI